MAQRTQRNISLIEHQFVTKRYTQESQTEEMYVGRGSEPPHSQGVTAPRFLHAHQPGIFPNPFLLRFFRGFIVFCVFSHWVGSDSFTTSWTIQSIRLLCPWDFPLTKFKKNTRVGCHFLLQGSSRPRDRTCIFSIGRWLHYRCATREAPETLLHWNSWLNHWPLAIDSTSNPSLLLRINLQPLSLTERWEWKKVGMKVATF